eukprot:9486592-Pyramimonas_sp.AAC.1
MVTAPPMGFAWAPRFCQSAARAALAAHGHERGHDSAGRASRRGCHRPRLCGRRRLRWRRLDLRR